MRTAVAILSAATLTLIGGGAASASPVDGHPATTAVTLIRPVNSAGDLKPGYHVGNTAGAGRVSATHAMCSFGSEAVGDAYRCFSGNLVLDPCWVDHDRANVSCLRDAWTHKVIDLRVTKGYDNQTYTAESQQQSRPRSPWGLRLTTGIRSTYLQGATGVVHGKRINYPDGHKNFLIGNLHINKTLWTIERAVDAGDGRYTADGSAQIVAAYYGEPTLKGKAK